MPASQRVALWRQRYWVRYAHYHRETYTNLKRMIAEQPPMTIWLGGPGRGHALHPQRLMIKRLLEAEGFSVIFSEQFKGPLGLPQREFLEFDATELAVILSISPGASGEALDFANNQNLKHKLYVYCPSEYKTGYVFQSLRDRHSILSNERVFSLRKLEQWHDELPHKILDAAIIEKCRLTMARKNRRVGN